MGGKERNKMTWMEKREIIKQNGRKIGECDVKERKELIQEIKRMAHKNKMGKVGEGTQCIE